MKQRWFGPTRGVLAMNPSDTDPFPIKKKVYTVVLVAISIATAGADGTVQFANSSLSRVKYQEGDGPIVNAPIGTKIGLLG